METKKSNFLANRQKEQIAEINKQIEELNSTAEKELLNQDFSLDNYKRLSKKIDALKEEKRVINISKKLDRLNADYKAKREFLKDFLKITLPVEDVTNQDGTIHKTKIKKYPELQKFIEKYDVRTMYYSLKISKYCVIDSREFTTDFDIVTRGKHSDSEEDKYLNFEELLQRNSIRPKNLTLKQFLSLESRLFKERKKIEETVKKYKQSLNSLQFDTLRQEKLIGNTYQTHLEMPSKIYH